MGMFKRILRNTSGKILASLGSPRSSHELNFNQHQHHLNMTASHLAVPVAGYTSSRRPVRKVKRSKKSKRHSEAASEALLLAAKNSLPPIQFHHVHGPNAQLSNNALVARRTKSFCQALVFSNRVILPNERIYIKILEIAKNWSGTIRFGFTSVDPATLRYQMPKHACPDMTNEGHTWARALADEVVRRNSVIHFSYNTNGYIHYGINNQDCGVFYANVNTNQNLWFIVDVYGLTSAIELIDPRMNYGSGEYDFPPSDQADLSLDSTLYKSTGAMAELFNANTRRLKKRARKMAADRRASAYLQGREHWEQDGVFYGAPVFDPNAARGLLLPNLDSIIVPMAQQNIYTPMPNLAPSSRVSAMPRLPAGLDSHDYHQIITSPTVQRRQTSSSLNQTTSITSPANHRGHSTTTNARYSALNSSSATSTSNLASPADDDGEISQQLSQLHLRDTITTANNISGSSNQLLAQTTAAGPKSTHANIEPTTATRRRVHPQTSSTEPVASTTGLKHRDHGKDESKMNNHASNERSSAATSKHSSSGSTKLKSLGRKSSRSQIQKASQVQSHRDNNNNSPPTKDCPICFERPINCVLYQCGHMCTCYECGVKQWRTQSRTCPICRTVIKDVIKTYMS